MIKALKMNNWFLIILVFITISCTKEYGYDIDPEIQPFFDIFEAEGAARDMDFDLEALGIGAELNFIRDNSTVGQCQTSDQGNKRIFVDKAFWSDYDFSEKEFIVFHELGHCFLLRDHDNSVDGRNCASIMQSGLSGCRNNYGPDTREAYLDELFSN